MMPAVSEPRHGFRSFPGYWRLFAVGGLRAVLRRWWADRPTASSRGAMMGHAQHKGSGA